MEEVKCYYCEATIPNPKKRDHSALVHFCGWECALKYEKLKGD